MTPNVHNALQVGVSQQGKHQKPGEGADIWPLKYSLTNGFLTSPVRISLTS